MKQISEGYKQPCQELGEELKVETSRVIGRKPQEQDKN